MYDDTLQDPVPSRYFFFNDQGIFFLKTEPESNQDFTLNYHFTGNKGKGGAS